MRSARETLHYSPMNNKKIRCIIRWKRDLCTGLTLCAELNFMYFMYFRISCIFVFHVISYFFFSSTIGIYGDCRRFPR